jgi:hypothetical protein
LAAEEFELAETLTELQAGVGILLKPGLLVLRVLIELYERTHSGSLSVSECHAFLLPCRRNSEWEEAFADVDACRSTASDPGELHRHARRNVQDWFKFLASSDYFAINGDEEIALTRFAIDRIPELKRFCAKQEDPATFWLPAGFSILDRLKWFDWFGTPSLDVEALLRQDPSLDPQYVAENYVAGLEDLEDDVRSAGQMGMNLRPVQLEGLDRNPIMRSGQNMEALLESIQRGMQKRHAKTLLHDRIVKELAQKFIAQGAIVESDPDSIDLFAAWPSSGTSAIFEIKTVTNRNFQHRLRAAVGQVEEYAYRREALSGHPSDRVIVVNADLDAGAWQRAFLTDYMGIGLICKAPDRYHGAAPVDAQSSRHWLAIASQ